jgi:glycine oxidase
VTVTIVGAGIVGCAIAYELASRGASVRVLDSRSVGRGATQAAAGILAPHIEGHSEELLRLAVRSLGLYDDFVARLRADVAAPFEYERCGTLQVAYNAIEAAALTEMAGRLGEASVSHALLNGQDAELLEPALASHLVAALLVPGHGYVAPDALNQALAEAASRHGATFAAGRVEVVHGGPDQAAVVVGPDTVRSDAVVVAGGSWASALADTAAVPVRPIRGQLLHLKASRRVASRVIWGERCYVVPWSDGSVLVGATVEDAGFDETATASGVRRLLDAALELVPELDQATFGSVRVGLRPMTGDELPAVGASSTKPRVFYAIGHYRSGVLLAPLTAALIADLVLDGVERPELTLTRPSRLWL